MLPTLQIKNLLKDISKTKRNRYKSSILVLQVSFSLLVLIRDANVAHTVRFNLDRI